MHTSSFVFVRQLASLAPTLAIDIRMKGIQANAEDAVLVRIQSDHSPSVWAGAASFLVQSHSVNTTLTWVGVPFPFVWGGVALSMYLSQKLGPIVGVPNLKNKK